MNACKKCRDQFVLAFYDELSQDEQHAFEHHLTECPDCAQEFEKLAGTLQFMAQRERQEPAQEFWDGFWGDVNFKIQQEEKAQPATGKINGWFAKLATVFTPKSTIRVATFAATLAVGIFLGKIIFNDQSGTSQLIENQYALSKAVQADVQDYLEDSQILLMGFANFDLKNEDPFILNIDQKKKLSEKLVTRAAVLKPVLSEAKADRQLELINELEIILMQLANLDKGHDTDAIEFMQSALDRQSIFLKINMEKLRQIKENSSPSNPERHKKESQI